LDEFVLAHIFGYIFKTLIVRDYKLVFCISIGFEILEVTFQHWLPNFKECWWDHLLIDVFGCNLIGTFIGITFVKKKKKGMKICEYFSMKVYIL
jgi:phosphatidylserine synthase 2